MCVFVYLVPYILLDASLGQIFASGLATVSLPSVHCTSAPSLSKVVLHLPQLGHDGHRVRLAGDALNLGVLPSLARAFDRDGFKIDSHSLS